MFRVLIVAILAITFLSTGCSTTKSGRKGSESDCQKISGEQEVIIREEVVVE